MDASADLARIRLVTARYHELNGLGRMGIGVGLITGAGVWTQVRGETLAVCAAMVTAICMSGFFEWVSRRHYYERRFGRVAPADPDRHAYFGLLYGAAVGIGLAAGYPNVLPLASTAMIWVRLATDWRFRPYLAVDVAAAVFAAAIYGVRPHAMPVSEYLPLAFAMMGASAILTGLCDHLLLVRTLKPTACHAEDEQPEHANTL